MKVIFDKPSRGSYGVALPGHEVDLSDDHAKQLIAQGIARHARPPKVQYETKIVTPSEAPEVSAREPFRDSALPDAEPATVDSEGNRVVSSSNIFERGAADSRGRGRRKGSDSGE